MDQEKTVLSEDPNAGLATPIMDLTAACIVAAIAIWFVIESLRLPVPSGIITAPGLLPFLTAASLLIMAGMLAVAALRRRRETEPSADRFDLPADFSRSALLGGILVVYVAALQYLSVDAALTIGSIRLVIGSFEVATVIILTAILRIFWQQVLWMCLTVAFGWTVFLSLVFRLVFEQQLP